MQRMKRAMAWLMMGLLILSLLPPGLAKQAHAAGATATYFIPDIVEFGNTSKLSTTDNSDPTLFLSRDTVYTTTSPTFTVTGTFTSVSKDSLKVKIEQLIPKGDSSGTTRWDVDSTRTTAGTVLADTGSTNRFTANNLTLFSGMNKITFTGLTGSVERSDTFYILYDRVPYLQSLKVNGGGTSTVLSEGSPAVVESTSVTLQGVAKNINSMSVAINGGKAIIGSVMDDGTFYSPSLALQPGLNDLTITIKSLSDSVVINRSIYAFNKTQPFTSMKLIVGGTDETELMNNSNPIVTSGYAGLGNQALLQFTLLVPYDANIPFEGNADYYINDSSSKTTIAFTPTDSETIIPGNDGITPQYRLITFTTDYFTFKPNSDNTADLKNQTFNLVVGYKGTSMTYSGKFTFLPGETLIEKMYYLPNYDETGTDFDNITKMPLDGAEVSDQDFWVLVKTAPGAGSPDLNGVYLPLGNTALVIDNGSIMADDAKGYYAYKITGFNSGQQKVRFTLGTSQAGYSASINYSTQDYIYVADIYDGMTKYFDSREDNKITVSGEYIGFKNYTSSEYFVNGVTPADPVLGVDSTNRKFNLELTVGADDSPLSFGENRIVFVGKTTVNGIVREIRKEIRIYIIDTNVSRIDKFQPTVAPALDSDRQALPDSTVKDPPYTQDIMDRIFPVSPEFLFKDSKYTTSQLKYDLVIKGGGATTVNLKFGSDTIFTKQLADPSSSELIEDGSDGLSGNFGSLKYDFAGDQDNFILRIKNIDFTVPGSHVYNLELINSTGARTNQRLEIVREVSAYRILSPQPTVGNDIVVNKNFVRFDIEAEGATDVLINGVSSTKRQDVNNRFVYDFVGLKPDKLTSIKIQIVRPQGSINDKINVYYTSAIQVDSQYMQAMATKLSVFNKTVELSFPKGTVLKSAQPNSAGVYKFYTDNKLLFGIADPKDGVVDRRNDYGNIINRDADGRSNSGATTITIPDINVQRFNSTETTGKFTRVSQIYWINGGWGEEGDKTSPLYKPAINGQAPYFIEGNTVRAFADPSDPIPEERKIIPSNRGTLKLSFNENVVDEVSYTISAFRFTDKGVWENVGGEVDMKKHTVTVPFDEFGYYMVGKLKSGYSDITNHPWARNILNGLYSKGIMTNLRFDEFGADDQTTRGEFATLLVKGLNIKLNYDDNQSFTDVVPGAKSATWDYEHIETAARAGIVSGLSEGSFGPDIKVTREDAAVMIARALKLKLAVNDSKLEAALAKAFVDSASAQIYARPSILAVTKAGVMSGTPVTIPGQKKPMYNFNPKSNLTRAEAGAITVKLLQKFTKIFPKNFS
ncbi:S-layer homology domain-containing protein [Cohnella candidum]|uniref:S-layer homology domain-containing protein n=1 Tax=Cohnella candidum TaxID=2674991 RepID=A0A3G3K1C6_9BACL|nr:S-layer homology domain-containing protein [Cohnella candidum]AYQ74180.1 S-layer homology domain-containing protein [Cohnella candidum]